MESFDHHSNNEVMFAPGAKWDYLNDSFATGLTTGRFGNGWSQGGGTRRLQKWSLGNHATYIMGMAIWINSRSALYGIASLLDGATGLNTDVQVELYLNADGTLAVRRSDGATGGTALGSGTTPVPLNIWNYVEWKVTADNSAGVVVVRLNGGTEINLSSQDTQQTANARINGVSLGTFTGNASGTIYDDIYVCDGSGSSPTNDFLGDVRVQALFPSGNGNSSQFDGSDGNSTDNYALVDETNQNGDTDYVESPDVGDKDTYAYGNMASTAGTVYGVQILPHVKKTDAGARSIVTVARLSATETDGPVQTLATTYQYLEDVRETKPGGGAWSIADVNNAEFGIKVNA